jgi:uncharacterized membrane protein YedE/YeeE
MLLFMVYFLSLIPIGEYPVLDSFRHALASLQPYSLVFWLLVVAVFVLALLTSIWRIRWLANIALGISLFLIAYAFPSFRNLYVDGRIIFVLFFLLIVATLMNRSVGNEARM